MVDFNTLTILELKKLLKDQGLPFSGNKSELISRLEAEEAEEEVEEVEEVEDVEICCPSCDERLRYSGDYSGELCCPTCDTTFNPAKTSIRSIPAKGEQLPIITHITSGYQKIINPVNQLTVKLEGYSPWKQFFIVLATPIIILILSFVSMYTGDSYRGAYDEIYAEVDQISSTRYMGIAPTCDYQECVFENIQSCYARGYSPDIDFTCQYDSTSGNIFIYRNGIRAGTLFHANSKVDVDIGEDKGLTTYFGFDFYDEGIEDTQNFFYNLSTLLIGAAVVVSIGFGVLGFKSRQKGIWGGAIAALFGIPLLTFLVLCIVLIFLLMAGGTIY